MDPVILERDIVYELNKECNRKYVNNKKNINDFSLEEINPIIGFKLSKRFLTAMGLVADIVEYLDHVMNFNNTKDTLLFLFIASTLLLSYHLALIYLPLMLVVKALYVSTTKETYPERELNFKKSYRAIQRIMKDTADYVEFYDLFMRNYVYWHDRDKTIRLIIEMVKLAVTSALIVAFIPLNYVLVAGLWYKVFQRWHFFWCFFTIMRDFNRNCLKKYLGEKYMYLSDPPLEGLIDLLKQENNNFGKYFSSI
jgi:hypothetical protein